MHIYFGVKNFLYTHNKVTEEQWGFIKPIPDSSTLRKDERPLWIPFDTGQDLPTQPTSSN